MDKDVNFYGHNFGGYTLFLWLSGICFGLVLANSLWVILGFVFFFIAINFFSKDNSREKDNGIKEVEVIEKWNYLRK